MRTVNFIILLISFVAIALVSGDYFKLIYNSMHYSKVIGKSNGDFLGSKIYIDRSYRSYEVGHFAVIKENDEFFVHPIIKVITLQGELVGYITKGIENKYSDGVIFPDEIIGRAFRILEDGSIEKDTKWLN